MQVKDLVCSFCKAAPGAPCVVLSLIDIPIELRFYHCERVDAALEHLENDIRKRFFAFDRETAS
jgi:hypothetical protein